MRDTPWWTLADGQPMVIAKAHGSGTVGDASTADDFSALGGVVMGVDITYNSPSLPNTGFASWSLEPGLLIWTDFDDTTSGNGYFSWRGAIPFRFAAPVTAHLQLTASAAWGICVWGVVGIYPGVVP